MLTISNNLKMRLPRLPYMTGWIRGSVESFQRSTTATLIMKFSGSVLGSNIIDAPTVNSLLADSKKLKFIDVRRPETYAQGHIPDAVNIHDIFTYLFVSEEESNDHNCLSTKFEKHFQQAGINGDELVIVYEDNLKAMNGASCRGLYLLKLLGY